MAASVLIPGGEVFEKTVLCALGQARRFSPRGSNDRRKEPQTHSVAVQMSVGLQPDPAGPSLARGPAAPARPGTRDLPRHASYRLHADDCDMSSEDHSIL